MLNNKLGANYLAYSHQDLENYYSCAGPEKHALTTDSLKSIHKTVKGFLFNKFLRKPHTVLTEARRKRNDCTILKDRKATVFSMMF